MRRLLVWTWKEAREHAARVRLLLVSIPVLTLLAGAIWSQQLTERHGDELSFGFVAAALVLHGLVVASGLFASDVGESAPAPAQRLPGGLGAAFVAKGLTWFTTALLAVLVGTLATAGVMWLAGQPERAWDVLTPWNHHDGLQQVAFAGEALVYSACVALAAACVRHPGSAVAAGTILFGVMLGTVLLGWRADPRVFPMDALQSLMLEALTLLVLGLAVVTAWLVGRRRVAAGWRAAALAGGVIAALYGAGAVHAAHTIESSREPDPAAEDWRIEHALIGTGGRYAFVELDRRIAAWPRSTGGRDHHREVRLVDLRSGTWSRLGRRGASLLFLPHALFARVAPPELHAHERVVVSQRQDRRDPWGMPGEVLWFNGASGALLHQELDGYPDPRGVGYMRDLVSDYSPTWDAQGRRTWIYDGFLERQGDATRTSVPVLARSATAVFPIVGGSDAWWIRLVPGSARAPFERFAWVDVGTGRVIERDQELLPPALPLSKGRLLVQRSPTNDLRTATWQVLDLASGSYAPAPGAPSDWPRTSWPVCPLPGDRVLMSTRTGGSVTLGVWDPTRGTSVPIALPEFDVPVESVQFAGKDVFGRIALRLRASKDRGDGWVVLTTYGAAAQVLVRPGTLPDWLQPLHLGDDGSLVCLAEKRPPLDNHTIEYDRIVRVGPEMDQIEVLFPRTKE